MTRLQRIGAVFVREGDLRYRNRQTLKVLLTIMAALAVAALLVGIRW